MFLLFIQYIFFKFRLKHKIFLKGDICEGYWSKKQHKILYLFGKLLTVAPTNFSKILFFKNFIFHKLFTYMHDLNANAAMKQLILFWRAIFIDDVWYLRLFLDEYKILFWHCSS